MHPKEKVIAFSIGLLPTEEQPKVEAHLASCSKCREDLMWLQRVDQMLGYNPPGHLSSAEIVAYAAGKLTQKAADHFAFCDHCYNLMEAAKAGLEKLKRLEREERMLLQ